MTGRKYGICYGAASIRRGQALAWRKGLRYQVEKNWLACMYFFQTETETRVRTLRRDMEFPDSIAGNP